MVELSCRCGQVKLEVNSGASGTRLSCCCNACRGHSKFLDDDAEFDSFGAVELFQTTPSQVAIISGKEALGAHIISEKGIMRWHCGACHTAMANTLQKPLQFIGLVLPKSHHQPNCPELGRHRGWVQRQYAPQNIPSKKASFLMAGLKILWRALFAKKQSDWMENGDWIVDPIQLSGADRAKLYERARKC